MQISDTHIGFRKDANPDVVGSLRRAIADIHALPEAPAFVVHTGDVSHLSKPEEFGTARELLKEIRVDRVHTVPGEHDTIDDGATGYLKFFDHDGNGKSWYSFDQGGVHFVGLNNVLNFKLGTMASLGDDQLAWLKTRSRGRVGLHARSSCSRTFRCGRSGSHGAGVRRIPRRRWRCCARSVP